MQCKVLDNRRRQHVLYPETCRALLAIVFAAVLPFLRLPASAFRYAIRLVTVPLRSTICDLFAGPWRVLLRSRQCPVGAWWGLAARPSQPPPRAQSYTPSPV